MLPSRCHHWTAAPLAFALLCSALVTAESSSASTDTPLHQDAVGAASGDRSGELAVSTGSNETVSSGSTSSSRSSSNTSATSTARAQSSTTFTDHTADDRALRVLLVGAFVLVALVALRPSGANQDRGERSSPRRLLRS